MANPPPPIRYRPADLELFYSTYAPHTVRGRVTLDPHNRWGGATGKNYAEGMLDVSYISGMASGVRTVVANTNATSATESGEAFGAALLAFLVDLNSRPDPPHIAGGGAAAAAAATKPNGTAELPLVLSLSLGSLSYSSCDKLCRCAAALLSSPLLYVLTHDWLALSHLLLLHRDYSHSSNTYSLSP